MKPAATKHPYTAAKLYRRKGDLSKRWYVEFGAWNGTRIERRKEYCPAKQKTEADRQKWGAEQCKEIDHYLEAGYCFDEIKAKTPPVDPDLSVNQVFDIAIQKVKSLRPKTRCTYVGTLNEYRAYLGDRAADGMEIITKSSVSDFADTLLESGLSAVTINNKLNKIRIMINKAVKAEFIKTNPFKFEKLTVTESFANVAFTKAHQGILEVYLKSNHYPLYVFTRLLYYGFIRPGEIIGLKIKDIDFERQTITVLGSVSKNRKTETIPIHPSLLELIVEYRHFPGPHFVAGKALKPGPYRSGKGTAYEVHKAALKELGFVGYGYTLYSWKHTGAVRAYEAGTDLKTLQFLLRHASVVFTEIYLKSLKLQLREVDFKKW